MSVCRLAVSVLAESLLKVKAGVGSLGSIAAEGRQICGNVAEYDEEHATQTDAAEDVAAASLVLPEVFLKFVPAVGACVVNVNAGTTLRVSPLHDLVLVAVAVALFTAAWFGALAASAAVVLPSAPVVAVVLAGSKVAFLLRIARVGRYHSHRLRSHRLHHHWLQSHTRLLHGHHPWLLHRHHSRLLLHRHHAWLLHWLHWSNLAGCGPLGRHDDWLTDGHLDAFNKRLLGRIVHHLNLLFSTKY